MGKQLVASMNSLPAISGTPSSLEAYISAAHAIPILSFEQEQAYARELQETGDINAAQQLVLPHLRFVIKVANNYSGYGLAIADLIQEGNIGLMKAVKRFDPDVGVRLVSFAVHWIKAEMHEYILKNWRIVKIATTKAQRKLFFKLRSQKKRLGWFKHEEVLDVAETLGVTPENVLEMENRLNNHDMPFDMSADDDDDSAYQAPAFTLANDSPSPELLLEHKDSQQQTQETLMHALNDLDDRSRQIVSRRWLTDNKSTLHELADEFGVSAERIRQIEKNAFNKIKTQFVA
ncbi:MAG: RNA polymerase sigma factor RpoH [Gammaproteobacteria bacterium]|jgi:RNA polymerase sigma-32 factor|nr:RNA polymerase sigma factor RpoH [Gammaproteobacteria bacterium]MBT3725991.1 RNA polymerase sigma factor RpoH [Gammaproteobacteria bacterium]MBT4195264.1 RNA polymerase sigma factor RpoH [Gammaproteobacteria bacterium]MBT4448607.1 RNA polymerase sigma factor RpoH [Gammaproteobacteria bacterium]MBT4860259.1 RNA polymerase sigma factor RpoH [Gammaproteobacteria bacterium]